MDTARWMSRQYFCSLGEALGVMVPVARRERNLPEWTAEEQAADHDLNLSPEQSEAVRALIHDPEKLFYLKGITGSGKTEVFLQFARWIVDQGKQVVYLVPEIALTCSSVRIWCSASAPASRRPSFEADPFAKTQGVAADPGRGGSAGGGGPKRGVRTGFRPWVSSSSTRSMRGGYKSSNSPRYHARQVAFWLAAKAGAKVVLGSATPSLEARPFDARGPVEDFNSDPPFGWRSSARNSADQSSGKFNVARSRAYRGGSPNLGPKASGGPLPQPARVYPEFPLPDLRP